MSAKAKQNPKEQAVVDLKTEVARHEGEIKEWLEIHIPRSKQELLTAETELQRIEESESKFVKEAKCKASPEAQLSLDELTPEWEKASRNLRHCSIAVQQGEHEVVMLRNRLEMMHLRLEAAEFEIFADKDVSLRLRLHQCLSETANPIAVEILANLREMAARRNQPRFWANATRELSHAARNTAPALGKVFENYNSLNKHVFQKDLSQQSNPAIPVEEPEGERLLA